MLTEFEAWRKQRKRIFLIKRYCHMCNGSIDYNFYSRHAIYCNLYDCEKAIEYCIYQNIRFEFHDSSMDRNTPGKYNIIYSIRNKFSLIWLSEILKYFFVHFLLQVSHQHILHVLV